MKKHFSIWDALQFGFSTTINNFLFFLGIFALGFGVMVGTGIFLLASFILIGRMLGHVLPFYYIELFAINSIGKILTGRIGEKTTLIQNGKISFINAGAPSFPTTESLIAVMVVVLFVSLGWLIFKLVHIFLHLGFTKIALDFHDYKTSTWKTLFSQGHVTFKGLIASIIYNLIFVLGLMLLIIPGIIWAIQFGFYQQVLVDEQSGIMQSLRRSSQITWGSRWNLLGLYAVLLLINIAGAIPMGLGLLVTIPTSILAITYAYRKLNALPMAKQNF